MKDAAFSDGIFFSIVERHSQAPHSDRQNTDLAEFRLLLTRKSIRHHWWNERERRIAIHSHRRKVGLVWCVVLLCQKLQLEVEWRIPWNNDFEWMAITDQWKRIGLFEHKFRWRTNLIAFLIIVSLNDLTKCYKRKAGSVSCRLFKYQ